MRIRQRLTGCLPDSSIYHDSFFMKHLLPLLCLAALTQPSFAQTSKLAPSLRQQMAQSRDTRAAETEFPAFIHITDDATAAAVKELGVKVSYRIRNILSTRLTAQQATAVSALPGVKYVDAGVSVRPMLDLARPASGIDRLQADNSLTQALTGKGVVIGDVDTGFDYCHPAFRAADGTTPRILSVWEQGLTDGTAPEGFNYGTELTTADAILTAEGDVTNSSHGTHVMGIAGGRNCGNDWQGVAPEADLVFVSMDGESNDVVTIADGVNYIFSKAKAQQRPCVVNLSLGTLTGPHDGTSTFDQLTDAMQGEGCIIVGSAGNFGTYPVHVATTDGSEMRAIVDFINTLSTSTAGGQIDVWGTAGQKFSLQIELIKKSTGAVTASTTLVDASTAEGTTADFQLSSSVKGSINITTEVNPLNSKPHALITFAVTRIQYGYQLALRIVPESADSKVDAWGDATYVQFATKPGDGFTPGNTSQTIGEIGGTGNRIITVGSYTTRSEYKSSPTATSTSKLDETVGEISSFSSAGPSADGRMKPDVCAPGCFIISALSSNYSSLSSTPIAGYETFEGSDYCWGYMQGTSMSSPLVAGTVALWLQANASLTPEQIREVIQKTSAAPADATDTAHWGYGKFDAWAGLNYIVNTLGIESATTANHDAPAFSARRTADGSLQVLFTGSADHGTLRLLSATGSLVRQLPVDRSLGEVTLSTAGLPHGTYVLSVGGKSLKVVL